MYKIENPILTGFNPDPSIIRVEDDYYIATSTFEWFPGVSIHHSKDLKNWKLISHPLNSVEKLNMIGVPNSGGIYAPCLTYCEQTYYLVYTNVRNVEGRFWDCKNYLITAKSIYGPWSEPIYLNGGGIDPSLFHDDDNRKWLVHAVLSHKDGGKAGFPYWEGIALTEYSEEEKRLIGQPKFIFHGSQLGTTEGPHIYKKDGWYYLLTAEGGTFYNHAVTMARARNIEGPYEIDPCNPIMTARYDVTLPLQRTGHADLVETQTGEWYMVHLCGRPLPSKGRSVMGRETGIQKVEWTKDGWLSLVDGKKVPSLVVDGPKLAQSPSCDTITLREDFDGEQLDVNFQSLRIPLSEKMMSLTERKGCLRLKGHESPSSKYEQSLVARRQQDFCYTAITALDFKPDSFQQMAGLICYYDTTNYLYLYVSCDKEGNRVINLMINDLNQFTYALQEDILLPSMGEIYLKVAVYYDMAQFFYSLDNKDWNQVGGYVEYSKLSDEYFKERKIERFTGAFVGMCCQDFTGGHIPADFDFFIYEKGNQ